MVSNVWILQWKCITEIDGHTFLVESNGKIKRSVSSLVFVQD